MLSKRFDIKLILLTIIAGILRFVNLGYSDFQGDEIKALVLLEPHQNYEDFVELLLTQRKGPVQFIITAILRLFDYNYQNELFVRFLFALAGTLAVVFFYKFVKQHFSEKVAFFAAFFLATNGFFVAFARIVQYQSFVILFMVLALYTLGLSTQNEKWRLKGLYLSFIFWAISILSHYDGVFIAPFMFYLTILWIQKYVMGVKNIVKGRVKNDFYHLVFAVGVFLIMLLVFYVPFVLDIDTGTQSYWKGRLKGTGGKISSSRYLFNVYQPIYVSHIYGVLFVLGLVEFTKTAFFAFIKDFFATFTTFEFVKKVIDFKLSRNKKLLKVFGPIFMFFSKTFQKSVALMFWFIIPLFFLEVVVSIPGTHIYTYLLPMFIFLGMGVEFIYKTMATGAKAFLRVRKVTRQKIVSGLFYIGVLAIFGFIFLQSYAIFVDHKQEYPWHQEKFLIWQLHTPSPTYHLSMFGFPYYRGWEDIGEFVRGPAPELPCPQDALEICPQPEVENLYYSTNERKSIARYHIPYPKDTDSAGYFVYINNPQSFTNEILSKKAEYWAENYEPVFEVGESADVYYMPVGSLEEIKALGY